MRHFLLILGVAFLALSCKETTGFEIHNGVNIAHWLSQSSARGEVRDNYFTEADVRQIAAWGFDHIRIPIDEEQMFQEDGSKDEEAFALLHRALDLCLQYRLRAVVDLHILRTHHFNADVKPLFTEEWAQEAFFECWRKLSSELSQYSTDWVAYELMHIKDKYEIGQSGMVGFDAIFKAFPRAGTKAFVVELEQASTPNILKGVRESAIYLRNLPAGDYFLVK